jgi:hypothetical protein
VQVTRATCRVHTPLRYPYPSAAAEFKFNRCTTGSTSWTAACSFPRDWVCLLQTLSSLPHGSEPRLAEPFGAVLRDTSVHNSGDGSFISERFPDRLTESFNLGRWNAAYSRIYPQICRLPDHSGPYPEGCINSTNPPGSCDCQWPSMVRKILRPCSCAL